MWITRRKTGNKKARCGGLVTIKTGKGQPAGKTTHRPPPTSSPKKRAAAHRRAGAPEPGRPARKTAHTPTNCPNHHHAKSAKAATMPGRSNPESTRKAERAKQPGREPWPPRGRRRRQNPARKTRKPGKPVHPEKMRVPGRKPHPHTIQKPERRTAPDYRKPRRLPDNPAARRDCRQTRKTEKRIPENLKP